MDYKEARQLVLDDMVVVALEVQYPWAYAKVESRVFGIIHEGRGFAKYRLSDKKQGLPWSNKQAKQMVIGRAVKKIAKRVMRTKVLQIGVTVTGAKLLESDAVPTPLTPAMIADIKELPMMAEGAELRYNTQTNTSWIWLRGEDDYSADVSVFMFEVMMEHGLIAKVSPKPNRLEHIDLYMITSAGREALEMLEAV